MVNGSSGAVVVGATTAATFSVPVTAGSYLPGRSSCRHRPPHCRSRRSPAVQATAAKHLGSVSIGLNGNAPPPVGGGSYPNLASSYNDVGITADSDTAPGNFDGGNASFSETALTNAGPGPERPSAPQASPSRSRTSRPGTNDNTVAEGQTIDMSGSGTLGFLASASYGPATGTGTITYTDGSTQSYTLDRPGLVVHYGTSGGAVAVNSAYQNRQGNTTYAQTGDIFSRPSRSPPARPSRR